MIKVSVVMPTYNCGDCLDEAIKSVLNQSYKDLELIIVDGGSRDSTDAVLERYRRDPQVRYVKRPNYGISAARNYGIKLAQGELIAFLDGDDLFLDDKILKQVRFFEKNRFDICYTNRIYFNSATKQEKISTYYHFSGDIFYYLKRNNFIHPSVVMARKRVFNNNLFDESLATHEDWELFLRLASKGICFAFINEALTKIRIRESSIQSDTAGMDATRKEVGMRAKEYWKNFKREMSLASVKGYKAILRYLKFKIGAFLIGFPKHKKFNFEPARKMFS